MANTNVDDIKTYERDPKRYLWVIAPLSVAVPMLSVLAYLSLGQNLIWCAAALIYLFILIPILDTVFGEDPYNLSEAAQARAENDPYYKAMLWSAIPLYYANYIIGLWFVMTQPLPLWAQISFILGVAFTNGGANNTGHEMGHKASKWDQFGALLVLTSIGNGHFNAEHNLNHHSKVATPEDPSSSRMGETLYAFAARDMIGAVKGAWHLETRRLKTKGFAFVSWRNKLLISWGASVGLAAALILALGLAALPFILLYNFIAVFTLSLANYVEHYGLLRQKRANGKYQPCEPRHSWNTNHIVSNLMTLHLQRHSDHHTHPRRPYQILRNFEDLPSLPSGYPGSFSLALIPPLWFAVMDKKVMAWAGGDLDKVNICPRARAKLQARWDG